MEKSFIYVRVSDDRQVENTSLGSQEDLCREYCRQKGWTVEKVFADRGESAKTADRPQLQQMMLAAKSSKIKYIVFYKWNRLARNLEDQIGITASMSARGVRLVAASEPTPEGATGKLLEHIIAAVNQFENEMRAETSKRGMFTRLSEGTWTWRPIIGYMKGMKVDPRAAPLIHDLFAMVANGETKDKALEVATARGLRYPNGTAIKRNKLNELLRNKLYMGW